ncbi:cytochrome c oxidase assembly protein [Jatrophihabitans fulvus]
MTRKRIPRLALVAWALAVAVFAVLAVAVARYLSSGSGHMHTANALTRGGESASDLSRPLHEVLFSAWHLDATAVAVLVVVAALYLTGAALVPVRTPGARWPVRNTLFFLAGLGVTAFATNGSIAVYDQVLFSAHMAGHLALVMVAPALLMWGRPLRLLLESSTPARRARWERVLTGRVVSLLTAPPVTLATYTAVIVGSHLTGLMDTIMASTWAGQIEHLVYLVAGCQFFVLIVGDEPIRWKLSSPARWLLLALGMAVDTFTGIVLMQGTDPIGLLPSDVAVNALDDTRTGGAIMWFAGDGIMAVIMIGLVITWLRQVETGPVERGWLEQARSATFAQHTGSDDDAADGIDDEDERAREAYNRWLEKINSH